MLKQFQKSFISYTGAPLVTLLVAREGEGGEGGGDMLSISAADLQKRIDDAVGAAVGGLKSKNEELLGINKKLKEQSKNFENLNLEELRALQEKLDKDEDARLIAEGKINQVMEKHTQRMREAHAQELAAKDEAIAAEAKRADSYRGHVLDSQLLAVTQGLHKGAVEDALLLGRQTFTLDQSGKAVQMDSNGNPTLGKDGKSPFSPAEWIEQMKEQKPHWFPATSSGSGSGNAREAGNGGKTMKRADFDSLSGSEKAVAIQKGIKIVD